MTRYQRSFWPEDVANVLLLHFCCLSKAQESPRFCLPDKMDDLLRSETVGFGNRSYGRSTNDLLNWDFCLRTTFFLQKKFSSFEWRQFASDQVLASMMKYLGNQKDSLCLVFLGRTVLNKTKFFKDNFYWEKAWVSSKAKFQLIKICLQKREVS